MKEYRGKIILTSVVTVLPIVIGLLLWNRLPDTIATHFTFDNVANGWSSKPFTVLGLPIILTVLHLVAVTVSLNDPKRKNYWRKDAFGCILDCTDCFVGYVFVYLYKCIKYVN